jgi:hypothetical protein
MKDVGEMLLGPDLTEDRALTRPDPGEREREGDGGLADAPLAGDEHQPLVEQPALLHPTTSGPLRPVAAARPPVRRRTAVAAVGGAGSRGE